MPNALAYRADHRWTPAHLTGITGWWQADDVSGAGGASVASWTDRIASLAVTQGTGAAQPTVVVNSGSTGHRALRFTAASSQIMTAGRGGNTNVGPFYCWIVHNLVTTGGQRVAAEVATPATNNGWEAGYSNAVPNVIMWNVTTVVQSGGDATGVALWREYAYDPTTAQQGRVSRNNLASPATASLSSQAITGGTTISIGGSSAKGTFYLDSEVIAVIVGIGYPSAADKFKFARWLWRNYAVSTGTIYNASASVATAGKNFDGSDSSDAIELGVVYNGSGAVGHNYWLVFAPYTSANVANENPNIAYSSDGNTWSSVGFTNPLVAYPGGGAAGNLADPSLFDNTARDSLLYIYYVRENVTVTATNGVYYLTYDGVSWSAGAQTYAANGSNFYESPVVAYDPASSTYWMYVVDLTAHALYRMTASTPTGAWSAQTLCAIKSLPSGIGVWHLSVPVQANGKWVIAFSDNGFGTARRTWLASSFDGLTWNTGGQYLSTPGLTAWDSTGQYRPAIQDAGDGANLKFWYIGGNSGTASSNVSQMVTVPYTEIP